MQKSDLDTISTSPDGTPPERQPAWRKAFPIDWSLDEYRSRREFVEFLIITSAAFVAGQFWILLLRAFRSTAGKPAVESIASVDELPVGGSKLFQYPRPGNFCILIRLNETEFVAYGQKCTHLSCPVLPRPEAGRLHCPCHNGWFDIRTGEPVAGPPRRPLPRVGLDVKNGKVYANGYVEGVI
jgi:nitrite reductase/ring-hydroxylating ferredoxin subunit